MNAGYFLVKAGSAKASFECRRFISPELLPGQFRVRVSAFGLNFADVMARRGKYREAPSFPFIPGYDFVGVVEHVFNEDDTHWIGKRVAGFSRFGGYATSVITTAAALVEIGDMDSGDALSLCTQGVTASFMADQISDAHKGRFALVHAAAGGVGSLLLQFLHLKGLKTIAKVSSSEKSVVLQSIRPTHIIVSDQQTYDQSVKKILGNELLIASFNAVAGNTVRKDLSLIGSGGKLFLFGGAGLLQAKFGIFSLLNFARKTGFFSPIPFMMQSKGLIGVNLLKIADSSPSVLSFHLNHVFKLYQDNLINPLPATAFNHQELCQAHELLESGKSTGKIVIYWGDFA
ncbi:MAG: zinc-binding alcohol dehydrogenase family protein [Flavobacteriales bacterium]